MKKFLIATIIFIIPVLLMIATVNIYVDSANVFKSGVSENVAKLVLNGDKAYAGSNNFDERKMKLYMAENIDRDIECVVVGPSLSAWINSDMVGTDSFLNLSVTNGTFYDLISYIGALNERNEMPERIIICAYSRRRRDSSSRSGWA